MWNAKTIPDDLNKLLCSEAQCNKTQKWGDIDRVITKADIMINIHENR